MLTLERVLGKDALSVICKKLHQMLIQDLNDEFSSCTKVEVDEDFYCLAWRPTTTKFDNASFAYNFRYNFRVLNAYDDDEMYISNKYGRTVGPLPKNY